MGHLTGERGQRPAGYLRISALLAAFSVIAFHAHASETVAPYEGGEVGLAGMLAGLLIFALVALYNHQRANRGFAARIAALEKIIEAREDRIWSLEERFARATELVDAQGDLVVREDELGRVTHASAAACSLLGKPIEEIVGRNIGFNSKKLGEKLGHLDGSITFDQEIVSPGGNRWIAWKEVSMRDESGRVIEVQRVGRDVTDRVMAERALAEARETAEAASRAKSRFLAVVSHEVRTPLNGILGMADLLLDTKLTAEQETYARAVKTSGDALLGLIEEILDFSKIEAGRLVIESVPFNLSTLVTDVVELVAPRAQAKGIEIAADIADEIPEKVAGDAARLRQVLLNLAGNAVKFTDEGGISVVVERAGKKIRFSVSDTGPGIGADARARIFHEFEQGDTTLARRHGGTGLGLAIAARIVEGMGGEIALESNEENGSRFSFAVELPEVEASSTPFPANDLTGANILVASPSPVVGPMIARRLGHWGANVSLASKTEVAESILPERTWTHVLVDRAFGFAEAAKLVQSSKQYSRYRHILLSPAERGELPELREAGFESYLIKPIRSVSLAARLTTPDWSPPLVPELDSMTGQVSAEGRSLMVLVAEDNDINALLVQALLTKLGHAPTVVSDGISAVTSVATAHAMGAPYDAVLMDLHLPGLDGLEATRRIRALGNEGGNVAVIALTANAFAEDREACMSAGMDEFVTKPVSRERLIEAMDQARSARSAERLSHAI